MRNKRSTRKAKKLIVWGVIVLAAALIGTFFLLEHVGSDDRIELMVSRPALTDAMQQSLTENGFVIAEMEVRTLELLVESSGTQPYIISWYMIPGRILSQTPHQSAYLLATDQVLLLRYYIASGQRVRAEMLMEALERDFMTDDGYMRYALKADEINDLAPQNHTTIEELEQIRDDQVYSLEATTQYLLARMEYYQRWGKVSEWDAVVTLFEKLYAGPNFFIDDRMIVYETFDPATYLISVVSANEDQLREEGVMTGVSLAGANPYPVAIMLASDADVTLDNDDVEHILNILKGGQISDFLPLFAATYSPADHSYVYYDTAHGHVDLISSLKVAQMISLTASAPPDTTSWLKQQLYNQTRIATQYNLISGLPIGEKTAIEAYPLAMQLARIHDDDELFSLATKKMRSHLAINPDSLARGCLFSYYEYGQRRVVVRASDNLQALLAMA